MRQLSTTPATGGRSPHPASPPTRACVQRMIYLVSSAAFQRFIRSGGKCVVGAGVMRARRKPRAGIDDTGQPARCSAVACRCARSPTHCGLDSPSRTHDLTTRGGLRPRYGAVTPTASLRSPTPPRRAARAVPRTTCADPLKRAPARTRRLKHQVDVVERQATRPRCLDRAQRQRLRATAGSALASPPRVHARHARVVSGRRPIPVAPMSRAFFVLCQAVATLWATLSTRCTRHLRPRRRGHCCRVGVPLARCGFCVRRVRRGGTRRGGGGTRRGSCGGLLALRCCDTAGLPIAACVVGPDCTRTPHRL